MRWKYVTCSLCVARDCCYGLASSLRRNVEFGLSNSGRPTLLETGDFPSWITLWMMRWTWRFGGKRWRLCPERALYVCQVDKEWSWGSQVQFQLDQNSTHLWAPEHTCGGLSWVVNWGRNTHPPRVASFPGKNLELCTKQIVGWANVFIAPCFLTLYIVWQAASNSSCLDCSTVMNCTLHL